MALSLEQPDGNGNCITDSFQVVGGASTVPTICGENSGQHMYVYFNGDSDIKIIVSAVSLGRFWNIKVAQIGCDCPWKGKNIMFFHDVRPKFSLQLQLGVYSTSLRYQGQLITLIMVPL